MEPPVQDLPIEGAVAEIRAALADHTALVVEAEPGAGKSTVLPLRLMDEPWLGEGQILMLEPRRLAARAIARRMASLLGERVGERVGLITRDDAATSRRTRIVVMTEGVLTNRIQRDPGLDGAGMVIFDEFHERSLQADLGLALTLDAQLALRPDLRIVTASATIDTDAVASLVEGVVVSVPGRVHPVDVRWRPRTKSTRLERAVAEAVGSLRDEHGDVLVFLPGAGEIHSAIRATASVTDDATDLLPLHGGLPVDEQDRALAPSPPGRRRVVFSTDIAETSLTVEGVRCVIDSGLRRTPRFDPRTGMSRLTTVSTSRASADQRAGRAGRTEPGVAVRLWSKIEHAARAPFTEAEILHADLASFALETAQWGAHDPAGLVLLDQPPAAALDQARDLLGMLGLIGDDGRPTGDGARAASLGVHPRLARMLMDAEDPWLACICAALLEERDILRGGGRGAGSVPVDLATRVELVEDRHRRHRLADGRAIGQVRRRAIQLLARVGGDDGPVDVHEIGATLARAYPDRIAQARGSRGRFRLRGGSGAWIPDDDPMAAEAFLVAPDLDGKRKDARIRLAAPIDPDALERIVGAGTTREEAYWDPERDDLYVRTECTIDGLRFSAHDRRPEPAPWVTEALIDRVVETDLSLLGWTDRARALQRRIQLVAAHRDGWPEVSDEALAARAHDWLGPYLTGAVSRADVEALDVELLLQAELAFDQFDELARLAPETIDLPGGRPVAIDYGPEPRVSVRAQRLYGLSRHPSVIDGAVPLVVEVLSPADRPIQVTTDVPGFWDGSWAEVRKDMAGRYPKHSWPEDPRVER